MQELEKKLIESAKGGDFVAMEDILKQKDSFDINAVDDFQGASALLYAVASSKDIECVKLLIDADADINKGDKNGVTPLMHSVATLRRDHEITNYLLDNGADIDAVDRNGSTALMLAASCNMIEELDNLLEKGANVLLLNNNGKTAYDLVKEYEYYDPSIPEICAILETVADKQRPIYEAKLLEEQTQENKQQRAHRQKGFRSFMRNNRR